MNKKLAIFIFTLFISTSSFSTNIDKKVDLLEQGFRILLAELKDVKLKMEGFKYTSNQEEVIEVVKVVPAASDVALLERRQIVSQAKKRNKKKRT